MLLVQEINHLFLGDEQNPAWSDGGWRCPCGADWPARHPSPKKSPGPSIATMASLPVFDSTESLTPPV